MHPSPLPSPLPQTSASTSTSWLSVPDLFQKAQQQLRHHHHHHQQQAKASTTRTFSETRTQRAAWKARILSFQGRILATSDLSRINDSSAVVVVEEEAKVARKRWIHQKAVWMFDTLHGPLPIPRSCRVQKRDLGCKKRLSVEDDEEMERLEGEEEEEQEDQDRDRDQHTREQEEEEEEVERDYIVWVGSHYDDDDDAEKNNQEKVDFVSDRQRNTEPGAAADDVIIVASSASEHDSEISWSESEVEEEEEDNEKASVKKGPTDGDHQEVSSWPDQVVAVLLRCKNKCSFSTTSRSSSSTLGRFKVGDAIQIQRVSMLVEEQADTRVVGDTSKDTTGFKEREEPRKVVVVTCLGIPNKTTFEIIPSAEKHRATKEAMKNKTAITTKENTRWRQKEDEVQVVLPERRKKRRRMEGGAGTFGTNTITFKDNAVDAGDGKDGEGDVQMGGGARVVQEGGDDDDSDEEILLDPRRFRQKGVPNLEKTLSGQSVSRHSLLPPPQQRQPAVKDPLNDTLLTPLWIQKQQDITQRQGYDPLDYLVRTPGMRDAVAAAADLKSREGTRLTFFSDLWTSELLSAAHSAQPSPPPSTVSHHHHHHQHQQQQQQLTRHVCWITALESVLIRAICALCSNDFKNQACAFGCRSTSPGATLGVPQWRLEIRLECRVSDGTAEVRLKVVDKEEIMWTLLGLNPPSFHQQHPQSQDQSCGSEYSSSGNCLALEQEPFRKVKEKVLRILARRGELLYMASSTSSTSSSSPSSAFEKTTGVSHAATATKAKAANKSHSAEKEERQGGGYVLSLDQDRSQRAQAEEWLWLQICTGRALRQQRQPMTSGGRGGRDVDSGESRRSRESFELWATSAFSSPGIATQAPATLPSSSRTPSASNVPPARPSSSSPSSTNPSAPPPSPSLSSSSSSSHHSQLKLTSTQIRINKRTTILTLTQPTLLSLETVQLTRIRPQTEARMLLQQLL